MAAGQADLTTRLRRAEPVPSGDISSRRPLMPDVDPLAFDIRFALTHKPIGREARKLIRSLLDDAAALPRGR